MKLTTTSAPPTHGATEMQEAVRGRERYLSLVQSLREPSGYSAPTQELSLRHCQARMAEYQQIMRMIVRPTAAAGTR